MLHFLESIFCRMWKPKFDEYLAEQRERTRLRALKRAEKDRVANLKKAERRKKKLKKERAWLTASKTRRKRAAIRRAMTLRAQNPRAANLYARAANHRKRPAAQHSESHFTARTIEWLIGMQMFKCANPYCDTFLDDAFEIDHIVPLAKGGSNAPSNIQLLCKPCNRKKRTMLMNHFLDMCESLSDG